MKVLDRKQAADILRVSIRTIDRYISRGVLPKKEIGGRIFIRSNDLKNFLEKKHLSTDSLEDSSQSIPDFNLERGRPLNKFPSSETKAQSESESEVGDYAELEVLKQNSNETDHAIYQKLYEEAQDELKNKQERLEAANYRVGQLEGALKETVPLLEFKKALAAEKDKRDQLENLLTQIEANTETLTQTLNSKENELIHVSTRLEEEKVSKKVFLVILVILFLLQPLWVLFPPL
ncbi:MAG: helix-turn-helix domain-containing protein [Candidatus Altimarinota bacterium]